MILKAAHSVGSIRLLGQHGKALHGGRSVKLQLLQPLIDAASQLYIYRVLNYCHHATSEAAYE